MANWFRIQGFKHLSGGEIVDLLSFGRCLGVSVLYSFYSPNYVGQFLGRWITLLDREVVFYLNEGFVSIYYEQEMITFLYRDRFRAQTMGTQMVVIANGNFYANKRF